MFISGRMTYLAAPSVIVVGFTVCCSGLTAATLDTAGESAVTVGGIEIVWLSSETRVAGISWMTGSPCSSIASFFSAVPSAIPASYLGGGLESLYFPSSAVSLRGLFRKARKARSARIGTPSPTPTPTPAFAPVESPLEDALAVSECP